MGGPLEELRVPFGEELVHYAIGVSSCGVPGLPAGLDALWRRHGRLPWPRLVEPALRLARDGVPMPPAHAACLAMLEPVMTMREGGRIYAPAGRLLRAGERLEQPGLVAALELVAAEGARTVYEGALARSLLALMDERGGAVTRTDLETYEARWGEPDAVEYATTVLSRRGLQSPLEVLAELPPLRDAAPGERALALVEALDTTDRVGHTTNLTVVDRDGNACVLTTSLGLGSGDWLPGLDLHLNSMLGETDLLVRELGAGDRMESMMSPTLVVDDAGPALALGAAGGTRLRSALVQVLAGVLDEGLSERDAVERPRLHPADGIVVHAEPGVPGAAIDALERAGHPVRRWREQHHYFGGVSAIGRTGAAGDPRRSGAATTLP
jgi:gamma-glutamyltranspeptidase/glutathione hydrolase